MNPGAWPVVPTRPSHGEHAAPITPGKAPHSAVAFPSEGSRISRQDYKDLQTTEGENIPIDYGFDVDQNNIELFEAMRQDKKVADDCGDAFIILVEICILKMQKEVDAWTPGSDKQTVSPMVSKLGNAQDALKAYTADKEELDGKYFALAGSFHARREARQRSQPESKPDSKKLKRADAIRPSVCSLNSPRVISKCGWTEQQAGLSNQTS